MPRTSSSSTRASTSVNTNRLAKQLDALHAHADDWWLSMRERGARRGERLKYHQWFKKTVRPLEQALGIPYKSRQPNRRQPRPGTISWKMAEKIFGVALGRRIKTAKRQPRNTSRPPRQNVNAMWRRLDPGPNRNLAYATPGFLPIHKLHNVHG